MIQFVEHKNIDKFKWDNCIDNSVNNSILGYSWYLDVVFENWSALILNDYEAVFPLTIKSKFSINYLLHPIFMRCLAIYSKKKLTHKIVNDFIDLIPKNIKLINIYLQENTPFNNTDFVTENRTFQLLKLSDAYDTIKSGYNKSVLKNIRKAEKSELEIIYNVAVNTIAKSYQNNIGKQVGHLDDFHFKKIEKLMSEALKNNKGITIGIQNNTNQLLASGFFMKTANAIYFSFGSANAEGKASGAMYLMLDDIIKTYAQQVEKLDFDGSDIEGIANFNRNFGAKDYVYLQIKKNTLPSIVKWASGKL